MHEFEITSKIKSAIEIKLCKLGAYVDNELPEYILIMIANKKTKDSMVHDLQLFLGKETHNFIEWLHKLIEKYQAYKDKHRSRSEKSKITLSDNFDKSLKKLEKSRDSNKSKSKKKIEKEKKKSGLKKRSFSISRSRSPIKHQAVSTSVKTLQNTSERVNNEKHHRNYLNLSELELRNLEKGVHGNSKEINDREISDKLRQNKLHVDVAPLSNSQVETVEIEENVNSDLCQDQSSRGSEFITRNVTAERKKSRVITLENERDSVTGKPLKRTIESVDSPFENRTEKEMQVDKGLISTSFIITLEGVEKQKKINYGFETSSCDVEESDTVEQTRDVEDQWEPSYIVEENRYCVPVDSQFIKCRFWPSCKNRLTCQFLHPSEPCMTFPSCKFGALCNYIHPNCRYGTTCTKSDCPFTHYGPRSSMVPFVTKPVDPGRGLLRCVYFPNCVNVNCKFFHPNLRCKYGFACKLKASCMFYHPSIPMDTDLKWIAK